MHWPPRSRSKVSALGLARHRGRSQIARRRANAALRSRPAGQARADAIKYHVDPLARDERLATLEAILLVAREPLSTRRLARLAHLADGTEARTLIRRLNRLYEEGGSAFRAEEVAGGFQLLTRPELASWLRRLTPSMPETRLSGPALETLAVVAYRQPVMRAEIDAIRGVDCGEILRQLMDRDLVRIAGRAEELGRPYYYSTTKKFLQVFGLRHLDELPRAEQLRARARQGEAGPRATLSTRGSHSELRDVNDEEDTEREHHRTR